MMRPTRLDRVLRRRPAPPQRASPPGKTPPGKTPPVKAPPVKARPVKAPPAARLDLVRERIAAGKVSRAAQLLAKTNRSWQRSHEAWRFVAGCGTPDQVIPVALRLYDEYGLTTFAAGILATTDVEKARPWLRRRAGWTLGVVGRHRAALRVYKRIRAELADAPEEDGFLWVAVARLNVAVNKYASRLDGPRGEQVRGFVLVYNCLKYQVQAVMAPLTARLMQDGYAVAAVGANTLTTPRSGVPEFDRLRGCVTMDGRWRLKRLAGSAREWHVDWPAGVVETDGVNYYSYFQERLAQKVRQYRPDILEDPEASELFEILLERANVALDICESLIPVAATGKPVRIALMEPHMAPEGVIREWCVRVGHEHGIHTVGISVGYENYYNNLGSPMATTLAIEDMTAQPNVRMPFLGGVHRLQQTVAEDPTLDEPPDEQVLSWICQDRSRVDATSAFREAIARRAEQVREAGGKVFVALGKVSIDFAAPGDRGFVHADFVEWMNHLIGAVAGTDNLLLVKPHPHELREEIVVDGVQMLRDLVVPDLPENVVFLEHHSFNTHELAEIVDAAFLWNGTASLEFPVLGVPVYQASIWAVRDYPIGLEVLRTREEYEEVLQGKRPVELPERVRRRAAAQLRLMRSEHVAIPFRYVRRPALNSVTDPVSVDVDRLEALATEPDPHIDRAASRFFEFS